MSKRRRPEFIGAYELGDSFPCPCGKSHPLTGTYLAAHWYERAEHTCDDCGAVHEVCGGRVTLVARGEETAMDIKIRGTDLSLKLEKVFGSDKAKTRLSVWENRDRLVTQMTLSPGELKRLHEWVGQRLTEVSL